MPSDLPFLAPVRYALAGLLQAVGFFFALVSGMATVPAHMAPSSQAGLIVCFVGIETAVASLLLVRGLPRSLAFLGTLRRCLLLLSVLTLLGGVLGVIFKHIYHLRPDEPGFPRELMLWEFGAGSISLINLAAISLCANRSKYR